MDIYAKQGTKVVFSHPGYGGNHCQEVAAQHLKEGVTYTVDHTEVDSWHTDVFLSEVPGVAFNSVLFDDV